MNNICPVNKNDNNNFHVFGVLKIETQMINKC